MIFRLFNLCNILLILFITGCKKKVDLIVYNATVYTVDSSFKTASAFAVRDGKFVAVGNNEDIQKQYEATETIDAHQSFIYPGFIDAHCHFYGYAKGLSEVNIVGTKSMDEIIVAIDAYIKKYPGRKWIIGRGWDQNDWADKNLPTNDLLNKHFKDIPIVLKRVDGHALLASKAAIDATQAHVFDGIGGKIIFKNNTNTGLYIDNAMELIENKLPPLSHQTLCEVLQAAQDSCVQLGLTGLCDAGLDFAQIDLIDSLIEKQILKMSFNIMVSYSPKNLERMVKQGAIQKNNLQVNSFKLYADGALGSRGACLKEPYHDLPLHRGFLLHSIPALDSIISQLSSYPFQVNTHCIGDSANKTILELYAKYLKPNNHKRWRIEHAQVLDAPDFNRFKPYGIIPSVQPTHATSDMYWATDRLGHERVKYAYAYLDLLKAAGIIASGTDFPVESINPFYTFCAAVFRQDKDLFPTQGFQSENALNRETALRSMTIWAAYAQFQESTRGSIEPGKYADFILLPTDLMKADHLTIRHTKVLANYIQGKQIFPSKK